MFSERRRASDKVVAYDAEEKALTAKHIQRLQVSKFHRLMLLCGDTSTIWYAVHGCLICDQKLTVSLPHDIKIKMSE